ncbi:uncharacterized protein LOC131165664 [Malania oleifera]|uniref:uncharacterized protein LOC131165664 n=1 Tax=Malania oleifera TaxID=397392 RepID=UPI0025AE61EA|nr:uncharacterized protein LOC131165664 [Malania oleifera]
MVMQASKLILPHSSLSSPRISSVLFEPHSLSLALMHSDSSFSLYPFLSPLSLPPLPPLPIFIPPPSSSASFLLLRSQNPNSITNPCAVFIAAGPHDGGAAVLLRFWVLRKPQVFAKARVLCSQKEIRFHDKLGVVVNVSHGISVKLAGSVNYFAMYSVSKSKIWVFAVKMAGDDDDGGVVLRMMKCAVIECTVPVCSISISFGFLILGEANGVRVLPLRSLVKGRVSKQRRENKTLKPDAENVKHGETLRLPNGLIRANGEGHDPLSSLGVDSSCADGGERICVGGKTKTSFNGYLEGNVDVHSVSVNLRSVKLGQDLGQGSAYFVAIKSKEDRSSKSTSVRFSARAISIQALSANKFLILDSVGDLHLLCLSNLNFGSEIMCQLRQLPHIMKVRKLVVLSDSSARTQTFWISDGSHSVHMMALSDMDSSVDENDRSDNEAKLKQISAIQALFTSEKIQDIVPLATNAILILGQGDLFVYAIS